MDESNPVARVEDDDPQMNEAMSMARKTFRFFWRELAWEQRRIIPGLDMACVKAAFSDPPSNRPKAPDALEYEHMWLGDVSFDGKKLGGTLMNQPVSLTSVSEGDDVEVAPMKIGDWMYAISGQVFGGFTINLLRSRMRTGERKQHDAAWGLDFGDPDVVYVVPPENLGQEPPKPPGFFASLFGGSKTPPQDYKLATNTEHPMSVNMRESLENALAEDPSMVHSAGEDGFTFLHQLSLAGSFDGVQVLIQNGADVNQAAANGMTPLALAKKLGWSKVAQLLENAGATS